MDGQHRQLIKHQNQKQMNMMMSTSCTGTHLNVDASTSERSLPQWSIQETREFLMIRAELDPTFMETKRNKVLWEVIAKKMKDKGSTHSAEQCKCKWKNLVTRYKGCETMEPEAIRKQFPFYSELQGIFAGRMQRMLWADSEGLPKRKTVVLSSDEDDENDDFSDGGDDDDQKGMTTRKKKRIKSSNVNVISTTGTHSSLSDSYNLKDILEGLMKQHIQMEMQWREALEAREKEKRLTEMQWRQTMEALEKERMMMERRWREREEQRRVGEEARAEKRDALIAILLNKLTRDH